MWKSIKKKFAPYLLYLIVKFIYATNKKVYHHPKNDDKKPFIIMYVAWRFTFTNLITILAFEKVVL